MATHLTGDWDVLSPDPIRFTKDVLPRSLEEMVDMILAPWTHSVCICSPVGDDNNYLHCLGKKKGCDR